MGKEAKVESGQENVKLTAAERPVIDVKGDAVKALSVGPKEVLVMTFPAEYAEDADAVDAVRRRFLDVFPPNRFLIVFADDVQMAAVNSPQDDGKGRPYTQPILEAQAVADAAPTTVDGS